MRWVGVRLLDLFDLVCLVFIVMVVCFYFFDGIYIESLMFE